ncbi:MAG: hypothetical protein GXO54_07530 [Chloroflexi bacterium]|nr:hypothetical protein [Chloroflexota bacterium]
MRVMTRFVRRVFLVALGGLGLYVAHIDRLFWVRPWLPTWWARVAALLGMYALSAWLVYADTKPRAAQLRQRIPWALRLAFVLVLTAGFGWLFFASFYGFKLYRLAWLAWTLVNLVWWAAWLLSPSQPVRFVTLLLALTLVLGWFYSLGRLFVWVSSYPFPYSWSEANRLWDYSTIFARERYLYPKDKPIPVFNDPGRTLLFGLIYVWPYANLWLVRFWREGLYVFPNIALALLVFGWPKRPSSRGMWALLGLWGFLYLAQGPIYPPLVLAALLVWWGAYHPNPWVRVLALLAAGYGVRITRFTWAFAPFLWALLLVSSWETTPPWRKAFWQRHGPMLAAALVGSLGLAAWVPGDRLVRWLSQLDGSAGVVFLRSHEKFGQLTPQALWHTLTYQRFLWYRLWPNPSFRWGLLLALALGTMGLIGLLVLTYRRGWWHWTPWGRRYLGLVMAAFFIVGTFVSTKIGGGDNLHNYDMLLVGLLFTAGAAWQAGLGQRFRVDAAGLRPWLVIAVLGPVLVLSAYSTYQPIPRVPAPRQREILAHLRDLIQRTQAEGQGEILFMDFRHFLTFHLVPQVPLVPEYEKKFLIDRAFSQHWPTFEPYYRDLAQQRFALIITEPLKDRLKDPREANFAEENNAWVQWVVRPTLCYYKPIETWREVGLQVLAPREDVDRERCARLVEALR